MEGASYKSKAPRQLFTGLLPLPWPNEPKISVPLSTPYITLPTLRRGHELGIYLAEEPSTVDPEDPNAIFAALSLAVYGNEDGKARIRDAMVQCMQKYDYGEILRALLGTDDLAGYTQGAELNSLGDVYRTVVRVRLEAARAALIRLYNDLQPSRTMENLVRRYLSVVEECGSDAEIMERGLEDCRAGVRRVLREYRDVNRIVLKGEREVVEKWGLVMWKYRREWRKIGDGLRSLRQREERIERLISQESSSVMGVRFEQESAWKVCRSLLLGVMVRELELEINYKLKGKQQLTASWSGEDILCYLWEDDGPRQWEERGPRQDGWGRSIFFKLFCRALNVRLAAHESLDRYVMYGGGKGQGRDHDEGGGWTLNPSLIVGVHSEFVPPRAVHLVDRSSSSAATGAANFAPAVNNRPQELLRRFGIKVQW